MPNGSELKNDRPDQMNIRHAFIKCPICGKEEKMNEGDYFAVPPGTAKDFKIPEYCDCLEFTINHNVIKVPMKLIEVVKQELFK